MSLEKKEHRLLFVGFTPSDQGHIQEVFKKQRPEYRPEFSSFAEAGGLAEKKDGVKTVFINQTSGDEHGFALLRQLKTVNLPTPIVFIITPGDEAIAQRVLEQGADECIAGSGDYFASLPIVLDRALARWKYRQSAADLAGFIVQSRQEWITIIDAIMDFIFITDDACRLVKMNRAFASLFDENPKDLIGSNCLELFGKENPCRGCPPHPRSPQAAPHTVENTIKGELYQVSTFPLHTEERPLTIHVMKNITEMKKLKDLLYYSDKLASLGLLVGGVAHEINNPLTGIIGYAELLKMKPRAGDIDAELNKILDASERCRKIVENLLTFSRQKTPVRSMESINTIIDRAIELRAYWLRTNNIEIVREFGEPSTVFVDTQQIQLVILNVLINAEQAIDETGRGNGRIVFNTRLDPDTGNVLVRVSDNGAGIPKEKRAKVFDPFFTTKPVGVGTGLGLSISHGIVTEHGGTMWIESVEREGTTLIIEIPTGAHYVQAAPPPTGQGGD